MKSTIANFQLSVPDMTATEQTPISIGLLKTAFTSKYINALMTEDVTHDAARAAVVQLVKHTPDERFIATLIAAAMPENYAGNTIIEIPDLVRGALEKGFDEPVKDQKESFIEQVRAEVSLHHDSHDRGLFRVQIEGGGFRTYAIASRDAHSLLRRKFYRIYHRPPRAQELNDICAMLQAIAEFEGSLVVPALRIGFVDKNLYIDLGRADGLVVMIDPLGWRCVIDCPVHFLRSPGQGELPLPHLCGDISKLRNLLSLSDENWNRVLGFLLNALRYAGPYMCLLIEGEQGGGKSFLAWAIKRILDPHALLKQKLGDSDRDLMIQAQDHWIPVYDNVSGMDGDTSDTLCTLATGGGFATRKLYTDAEQQVFNFCRAFVINGLADFATRPDLLERAIVVYLPELSEKRREEKEMVAEFEAMLPELLGCLYSAAALALDQEEKVKPPVRLRMADAARWITAGEPALGIAPGTIVQSIATSQSETMNEIVRNHAVVRALEKYIADHPIEGTVGDIYDMLCCERERHDRAFPKTSSHFSRALKRLRPAMARLGIKMEFFGHARNGSQIRIWRDGLENVPARHISPGLKP